MRTRLGCWVVIAVLAAGCATADTNQPTPSDEADVRFMQHMAGHLLQTTSILDLTQDRITRPKLARLADTINQQGQAHLAQLQAWLASRGRAPYDPQTTAQQRQGIRPPAAVPGQQGQVRPGFVKVMTARHRAGSKLAATELREGTLPEVRQLAQQLLATQQAQIAMMTGWARAWAKASPTPPDGQTSRPSVRGRPARTPPG